LSAPRKTIRLARSSQGTRAEWGNSLSSTYQHLRRETISFSTESEQEKTESTEFTKWLIVRPVCRSLTGFNSVNFVHSVFMELEGIDHVAMSVHDVEAAANWYIDVLGFERRYEGMWNGIPVFIGKGTTSIALFPVRSNDESIRQRTDSPWRTSLAAVASAKAASARGGVRVLHLAFRADRKNFLSAQEELKQRGIRFEFQDHEISHSIYFSNPDGHKLEITTYELDRVASTG
jgi:catechol 2,3-dioxygenase-like lactoylglutathione lyase family enzyme